MAAKRVYWPQTSHPSKAYSLVSYFLLFAKTPSQLASPPKLKKKNRTWNSLNDADYMLSKRTYTGLQLQVTGMNEDVLGDKFSFAVFFNSSFGCLKTIWIFKILGSEFPRISGIKGLQVCNQTCFTVVIILKWCRITLHTFRHGIFLKFIFDPGIF